MPGTEIPRRRQLDWRQHPERAAGTILVITALLFAVAAGWPTWRLRADLRAQVLQREARALQSMVDLQLDGLQEQLETTGLGAELEDWFPALLETSKLRGVLALRLQDAAGTVRVALPVVAGEPAVTAGDWERLRRGESLARLHPDAQPQHWFKLSAPTAGAAPAPLLDVLVPLHPPGRPDFSGAARYWIDGAEVGRELAALDRSLLWRVGLTFSLGLVLALGVLAWSFGRLASANRRLSERTADLLRANRELNLAAKTSAVGAIAAHLIHGLRNPLAGLESFITGPAVGEEESPRRGVDWQQAVETTARVRSLVNEVVAILREEREGRDAFVLTLREVATQAESKIAPLAAARNLRVVVCSVEDGELSNRRANLVLLVLDNLLRNACEASPEGCTVTLLVAQAPDGRIEFLVQDEGPGLPAAVQQHLFQPVSTGKPGGSGIGLAISRHLARHAGGDLELVNSAESGSTFRLWLDAGPPAAAV